MTTIAVDGKLRPMAKVDQTIEAENANWCFSGEVSANFDQHVERSVPRYLEGHELVGQLADFFLQKNSNCYDLGCSTGRLLAQLAPQFRPKQVNFIGIDCEPDMLTVAANNCKAFDNISLVHADIADYPFESCDLFVAYYTMQFVPPKQRQRVFEQIYQSLNWGGGFILFEKVRAPDARFQDMMSTLYNDYKLAQGYSGDQIIAKARSLKGVLEPFSREGNLGLLQRAGFSDIMTVFKHICFEGFVAIK